MAERVSITVRATRTPGSNALTVEDAMTQVLEAFKLLSPKGDDAIFAWRLVDVRLRNPLTVEAEAIGLYPDLNVEVQEAARELRAGFSEKMHSIIDACQMPRDWAGKGDESTALRLLKRNLNGVAVTEIDLGPDVSPVHIDSTVARRSVQALAPEPFPYEFHSHTEYGSAEGTLRRIDTFHGKPCVVIRESGTRAEINCLVTEEVRSEMADRIHAGDVWNRDTVVVTGLLRYNGAGRVAVLEADNLKITEPPRRVSVDEILDPGFTGGLTAAEYIERLREGDLG